MNWNRKYACLISFCSVVCFPILRVCEISNEHYFLTNFTRRLLNKTCNTDWPKRLRNYGGLVNIYKNVKISYYNVHYILFSLMTLGKVSQIVRMHWDQVASRCGHLPRARGFRLRSGHLPRTSGGSGPRYLSQAPEVELRYLPLDTSLAPNDLFRRPPIIQ